MEEHLPGLPLHPGASDYLHPALDFWEKFESRLRANWQLLAILVILAGTCQGFLRLKRDRTSNSIGKKVFEISEKADGSQSVGELLKIRDEHDDEDPSLDDRVQMPWWQPGELDYARWQHLCDLVNDRIGQSQENLTEHLAAQLPDAKEEVRDPAACRDRLRTLEERVFDHFHAGEPDASQYRLLLEMIAQAHLRQVASATKERAPASASPD